MPPKMTGMPLARNWSAISQPALDLAGEHAGDRDEVDLLVEVDVLHMLVDERQLNIARDRGRKTDRPVRRQMKFGLPFQLRPFRINESDLHDYAFLAAIRKNFCINPDSASGSCFHNVIAPLSTIAENRSDPGRPSRCRERRKPLPPLRLARQHDRRLPGQDHLRRHVENGCQRRSSSLAAYRAAQQPEMDRRFAERARRQRIDEQVAPRQRAAAVQVIPEVIQVSPERTFRVRSRRSRCPVSAAGEYSMPASCSARLTA